MSTLNPLETPAILVVEDEVFVREDAIAVLEEEGFEALRAGTVGEALAVLERREDVRAVFTDIEMPGGRDGIDLARDLADRRPAVAVLVTSGRSFAPPGDLPEGSRFVPKPYMPRKVARILREMIGSETWDPGYRAGGGRGPSAFPA